MCSAKDDWGFGPWFGGARWWGAGAGPRGSRRRNQMFESGEVKFVILRLLKEKPRHGYEVIKALEEKMGGYYTPSAGTVYPTLQLLEDEGYVRAVETEGKKVYHVTPEGERYLEQHRDLLDDILDRVRETVRDFAGGGMGEVQGAFAKLAATPSSGPGGAGRTTRRSSASRRSCARRPTTSNKPGRPERPASGREETHNVEIRLDVLAGAAAVLLVRVPAAALVWPVGSPPGADAGELRREIESQRGTIERLENTVSQLEERLDFTERLLAGRHEASATS